MLGHAGGASQTTVILIIITIDWQSYGTPLYWLQYVTNYISKYRHGKFIENVKL